MVNACVPAVLAPGAATSRKQRAWRRLCFAFPLACSLILSPLNSYSQVFPPRNHESSSKKCTQSDLNNPIKDAATNPIKKAATEAVWALFSAISKGENPDMQRYTLIKKMRNAHYYYVELPTFDPKSLLEIADNMQRLAINSSKGTMMVNIVPDISNRRIYMDTRKVDLPKILNEIDVVMLEKIIKLDIEKGIKRRSAVPYLTGKGLELYANIPSKLMALISDGKVIRVYPAAFGSPFDSNTHSPVGHFTIGDSELDRGWLIPPERAINFQYFLETNRFPALKYDRGTIKIATNSMFCLMGHTKVRVNNPYDEMIKMHGRMAIFPATHIPVPAGMERSIKDDIPDQTTNACICIFDGSFYRLDGDRELILNGDILDLIKLGSISATQLTEGYSLPLRKGGYACLSKDKWGNPTWFKNTDSIKEIVSFKYDIDWSDSSTALVAWLARSREDSKIFRILSENRISRICIDYRSHYIEESTDDGRIKIVFFYDPYGKFNWNKEISFVLDELKKLGFEMDVDLVKSYFNTAAENGATLWYNKY